MVLALATARSFASGLDCRQQQCYQDTDDSNHDEQLHESKTCANSHELALSIERKTFDRQCARSSPESTCQRRLSTVTFHRRIINVCAQFTIRSSPFLAPASQQAGCSRDSMSCLLANSPP